MKKQKQNNAKKLNEKNLEELRKDFLRTIPQLEEIQQVQETHRDLKRKETEKLYPFIDTQSYSTV